MLIIVGTASLAISLSTGAVVIRISFASAVWADVEFVMTIFRTSRDRTRETALTILYALPGESCLPLSYPVRSGIIIPCPFVYFQTGSPVFPFGGYAKTPGCAILLAAHSVGF